MFVAQFACGGDAYALHGEIGILQVLLQISRWHNSALKHHYGHDQIKLFYAKSLAGALISCSAILLIYAAVISTFDNSTIGPASKLTTLIINSTMAMVFMLAYFQIRRGRFNLARGGFIATVILGLLSAILITGGFPGSIVTQSLIVLPVITFLFYGMRAGAMIAGIVPVLAAAQWAITSAAGITLPNVSADINPDLYVVLVTLVIYSLLVLFIAGYEHRQTILLNRLSEEREKLETLASQDPLTGLLNSRCFYYELEVSGLRAMVENSRLTVLYLDLNDFKLVNDTHGHQMGDAVLNMVAMRIKKCVRPFDIVARMGGDEFAILLRSEVTDETVASITNQLDQHVGLPISHGGTVCRISTSIGCASFPADVNTVEELLQTADQNMYKNKRSKSDRKSGLPNRRIFA